MANSAPSHLRILVDVSGSDRTRSAALEAIAELSFQHRFFFRLFGDTGQIARALEHFPYEAEFVDTVHCTSAAQALALAANGLRQHPQDLYVSAQKSAAVSSALANADCLLPGVAMPALAAIVPAVKSLRPGDRDRYCILLDTEAHHWPVPCSGETLIALARPLVEWFRSSTHPMKVGVLTVGDDVEHSAFQEALIDAVASVAPPLVSVGTLTPTEIMLGEADLALSAGEGAAMFVRTLEATFVAAEALVHRETQGVRGRLGLRIFRERLEKLRDYGNIESYGGSPLLGVRNPCVVLRPEGGTRAWMNAFRTLAKMHDQRLIAQQQALLDAIVEKHG